ncbi:LacI family DNA-binding transcriptional regulator [Levilactobacillus sp. N40-8-2]|uniref:LacI family DNA-binding transcriptional regulator n=1 Tax=Levilactobacillus muriae TaxID=3238987 RepID=UPI0038B40899
MTNIRDIAQLSGYSISTVSRVINHQNYVSDETRVAIQKVINQLDYVPNAVARDLSRGKTFNVGVVLPNSDHPYFTQLVHGIMRAAFATNYRVVLLPSKYNVTLELQYLQDLRQRAYDALIFTSHGLPLTALNRYRQYGTIVVCENPHDCPIPAAYAERLTTYQAAFNLLKQRGFHQIGLLASRPVAVSATCQAMVTSYQSIFHQAPEPELMRTDVTTPADAHRSGEYYIAHHLKPDAILTNGDDNAVGLLRAYHEHNQQPPYLIGQEHQLSGEVLRLPTIDHHFNEVGAKAFDLAVTGQQGKIAIASHLIVPSEVESNKDLG